MCYHLVSCNVIYYHTFSHVIIFFHILSFIIIHYHISPLINKPKSLLLQISQISQVMTGAGTKATRGIGRDYLACKTTPIDQTILYSHVPWFRVELDTQALGKGQYTYR